MGIVFVSHISVDSALVIQDFITRDMIVGNTHTTIHATNIYSILFLVIGIVIN